MKMYFIGIVNVTDYECRDFVAHYNDYAVAQESLEKFVVECEDDEYDDYVISFGESHWNNGILIDDWLEAKTIRINH